MDYYDHMTGEWVMDAHGFRPPETDVSRITWLLQGLPEPIVELPADPTPEDPEYVDPDEPPEPTDPQQDGPKNDPIDEQDEGAEADAD